MANAGAVVAALHQIFRSNGANTLIHQAQAAIKKDEKLLTIIGARPQFIKASVVSKAVAEASGLQEVIVHTGQHYDANMNDIFFDQLAIPRPLELFNAI